MLCCCRPTTEEESERRTELRSAVRSALQPTSSAPQQQQPSSSATSPRPTLQRSAAAHGQFATCTEHEHDAFLANAQADAVVGPGEGEARTAQAARDALSPWAAGRAGGGTLRKEMGVAGIATLLLHAGPHTTTVLVYMNSIRPELRRCTTGGATKALGVNLRFLSAIA